MSAVAGKDLDQAITPAMRAEASAWVARLHGPGRDERTEAGFRSWLQADTAHARAFEQTTEAWEIVGSVPTASLSSMVRWDRVGKPRSFLSRTTLTLAAVFLAAVGIALYLSRPEPLITRVGEQRAITLQDGSRVTLNTASRMYVRYDKTARTLELVDGEALFEVSSHPGWPFVVVAGERRILALGTSFIVRRDAGRLSVTLVEGKVAVTQAAGEQTSIAPQIQVLAPGQRLTLADNGAPSIDSPPLKRLTAWQRGLVMLDGTPLGEAVAEMNRYSAVALEVANPQAAALRVSGAFRAGDSLSFAQAVATTYQLQVKEHPDRIQLSGAPRPTYQQPEPAR